MGRRRLLQILQARCAELGVDAALPDRGAGRRRAVGVPTTSSSPADGINSTVRTQHADTFRPAPGRRGAAATCGSAPSRVVRRLHLRRPRDAVRRHAGARLPVRRHRQHVHRRDADDVWRAAGFDALAARRLRARRDRRAVDREGLRELFADLLDGHEVLGQQLAAGSASRRCATSSWTAGNVVLLGDAAHTAHFSIGSGTKLAMEDALALAACLHEQDRRRRPRSRRTRPSASRSSQSTQRAAQASLEWFENLGQYLRPGAAAVRVQPHDAQPAGHLRQPAAARPGVRRRRRRRLRRADGRHRRAPADVPAVPAARASSWPTASSSRRWTCTRAVDGVPDDFHLVHLGGKALGGAGLVMTEMVVRQPRGPDHPRLHRAVERRAGGRLAPHRRVRARRGRRREIGVQLGHSGRKGSTRLMWEGMDDPLPEGGWPVVGPSPLPYRAGRPGAARADPRRPARRSRRSSSRRAERAAAAASTCSSCTARTATCCRASCRR